MMKWCYSMEWNNVMIIHHNLNVLRLTFGRRFSLGNLQHGISHREIVKFAA